jgi:hypothetical protein
MFPVLSYHCAYGAGGGLLPGAPELAVGGPIQKWFRRLAWNRHLKKVRSGYAKICHLTLNRAIFWQMQFASVGRFP